MKAKGALSCSNPSNPHLPMPRWRPGTSQEARIYTPSLVKATGPAHRGFPGEPTVLVSEEAEGRGRSLAILVTVCVSSFLAVSVTYCRITNDPKSQWLHYYYCPLCVCVLGGQCFEAQLTLFRQLSLAEYLAHSSSSSRHGDLKAAGLLKWGVGLWWDQEKPPSLFLSI